MHSNLFWSLSDEWHQAVWRIANSEIQLFLETKTNFFIDLLSMTLIESKEKSFKVSIQLQNGLGLFVFLQWNEMTCDTSSWF